MITRSFRKIVSGLFYRERTNLKPSYVNKMLVAQLNELLGKKKTREDQLWEVINADMKTRFVWHQRGRAGEQGFQGSCGSCGYWEKFTRETLIHDSVTIAITMKMLSDFFGFTLNTDAWDTLQKPETYDYANPFHPSFIRSIWPRVKQMNIAHHALGLKLLSYVRASERRQESVPRYILQGTTTHFQQALAREPSSAVSMRKLGQTLEEIWLNEQKANPNNSSGCCGYTYSGGSNIIYLLRLQNKIEWAFKKAIARDEEDSFNKFCLGVFYDMLGRRSAALELYRKKSPRAYSLGNVITADALLYFNGGGYAEGCDERALDEAEALYRKAAADLSAHGVEKSLNNLAVLLCYRGKVAEAGLCFAEALRACKKSLWRIGPNCATYCDLVLGDLVLKQDILEEKEKQEAMLENVQE